MNTTLKIAMAQIAPVWLDKSATLKKIEVSILEAAKENAELIVFWRSIVTWLSILVSINRRSRMEYRH